MKTYKQKFKIRLWELIKDLERYHDLIYLEVDPKKFPHIRNGMVVRIICCSTKWLTWSKSYLVLEPDSNIMSFISSS